MRHFYDSYVGVLNGSDLTALVERYSPDAVLTTFEGIVTGHEAIRSYFEDGRMGAENAIIATEKFIEFGDSIYTESSVRTPHGLAHTYHAFVVQDGLITHQFAGVK
ncbi:MAG: nuclear transport factor 2 family protein [Chloroflexota bacterium]|nr:nuclear transport factor 2 family protein [Chloroflexota bacterium]